MRSRSRHHLRDEASWASVVGTSLMAVVTSCHGFDEPASEPPSATRRGAPV